MKKLLVLLSVLMISLTTFASNHEGMMKGKKALLETCKADIESFCKDVGKGKGKVIKCLKEKATEATFSAECKTALEALPEHKADKK